VGKGATGERSGKLAELIDQLNHLLSEHEKAAEDEI
jgi:hypothetical protein